MLLESFGIEGCVGPKIRSGLRTEEKNLLPQRGTEPQFFGLWNRRLSTILNEKPSLFVFLPLQPIVVVFSQPGSGL